MEKADAHVRFHILQTAERLQQERGGKACKVFPTQVDNCTYQDMQYHLRSMQSKGLVEFQPKVISRVFMISLTQAGAQLLQEFESAFHSQGEEHDLCLRTALDKLK